MTPTDDIVAIFKFGDDVISISRTEVKSSALNPADLGELYLVKSRN